MNLNRRSFVRGLLGGAAALAVPAGAVAAQVAKPEVNTGLCGLPKNVWNPSKKFRGYAIGNAPGNWSLGHVPTKDEVAVFDGSVKCMFTEDFVVGAMDLLDYHGTVDMQKHSITIFGDLVTRSTLELRKNGTVVFA